MKVIRIMFDNPITVQAGEQINVEYTVISVVQYGNGDMTITLEKL